MDSNSEAVTIIRSYEDFMPYCKFQKEELHDSYHIPLHGFKVEQIKVSVNEKEGTIKIEGEHPIPMDETKRSRFRQKFKFSPDLYNGKEISASFRNGVVCVTLPKKKPSLNNHTSKIPLLIKGSLLKIAPAVVVGVTLGVYAVFKCMS